MSFYGWEDNSDPIIVKETVICPVCKSIIDYRYNDEPISAYCIECKVTFVYVANNSIPVSAKPDSLCKKSKNCGCGRCNN